YADIIPILQREVPKSGGVPGFFTPSALLATRVLYGVDFYAVRPVDVVASIAPRPLFFIHGDKDPFTPSKNMTALVAAASAAHSAPFRRRRFPDVHKHAWSFHAHPAKYMDRVVSFFVPSLSPDTSAPKKSGLHPGPAYPPRTPMTEPEAVSPDSEEYS